MPVALQVRDLHFSYPPPTPELPAVEVLKGVSLGIRAGEFVALLGRIGAGKSTLCLAISGLVPQATGGVFRGEVLVAGNDTKQHPVAELARSVGIVFQDPETQLTQMRVEDEVAFGPENIGRPPVEIGRRLEWALRAVGLAGFEDRSPAHLSGGEKQRVTIAATLAMLPRVLVLDEPTSNLDPLGKAAVFGVLARLARSRRIAILIATQDVERVARYAGRALVLHEGRIVEDASPATLFSSPDKVKAWGIGLPQTAELLRLVEEQTGKGLRPPGLGRVFAILRKAGGDSRGEPGSSHGAAPEALVPESAFPITGRDTEPLIRFEHVAYSYPDGTPALRDVNLKVARGEFVTLVGPNGSGKTTLAKHTNGLLKPAEGRALLAGMQTSQARVAELARTAGYVFQNPDHQIFAPTVEEEIAFSLRLQGLPAEEVTARTIETLAEYGLSQFAGVPPALLGSGQRRQVALAAVLATRPAALILDEPTGGLDRQSRDEMMERVLSFHARGGTVVLITHDLRIVTEYSPRVVLLLRGQVAFDGEPGALFAERKLMRQAGLTPPPAVRLAQRLWGDGASRHIRTSRELADVFAL